MRTRIPRSALVLLSLVLALLSTYVYLVAFQSRPAVLKVSFLDVGQGDAILIEGPTGIEMLIDAGKDRSVVRELSPLMGPLDRRIDIVVATHPDADHIGGMPSVLERYTVSTLIVPNRGADTPQAEAFAASVGREVGAVGVTARRGMRIHLGGGAYADVLHPEEDASRLRETNDVSIVMRVVFGETEFLLTGDAPEWVEDRVVAAYGDTLASDVLKAGHHGSKTSTGPALLAAARPETVVISAGRDNAYGHPHAEVVTRILEAGAVLVSTAESGTLTFVSDGTSVTRR